MKAEAWLFNGIAAFLYILAVVYYIWTGNSQYGTDWIGSTALVLSGTLSLMAGVYFALIAWRIEPRPEDRQNAEIAEGAGEVGFYSPGSYWPIGVAAAASLAGIGVVFWYGWVMIIGGIAVLVTTSGLLFEYYTSSRTEAS